jgi:threonine dehydratase
MVGGKPPVPLNEHLYRFEFPEYPGALARFLETLGSEWNITLFHYRNHGAAEGNVLAAFDIAPEQLSLFNLHLAKLGYKYWDETDNPCFTQYLQNQELQQQQAS